MITRQQTVLATMDTRSDYLAKLQQLVDDCRSGGGGGDGDEPEMSSQLALLARAVHRMEDQLSELRETQHSAGTITHALERRVANLEHSAPSPQSWRDMLQGIRGIREALAAQSAQRSSAADA